MSVHTRRVRSAGSLSTICTRIFLAASCLVYLANASSPRELKFASPLQTLTIFDEKNDKEQSPRKRFLRIFQDGLAAEVETRKELAVQRQRGYSSEVSSGRSDSNWADSAARVDANRRSQEESRLEAAWDAAVAKAKAAFSASPSQSKPSPLKSNEYQFVGVIQSDSKAEFPISWFARPKPANSKWTIRLVHVNRNAVVKDLFQQGKVDITAKYKNLGLVDESRSRPVVQTQYDVKERSWKNLWNFSPKHFFTDSSGMYWRERRLQPGLYTDGEQVYEATYRYVDGRNGMRRWTSLANFLSKSDSTEKARITEKVARAVPDIVLEDF